MINNLKKIEIHTFFTIKTRNARIFFFNRIGDNIGCSSGFKCSDDAERRHYCGKVSTKMGKEMEK